MTLISSSLRREEFIPRDQRRPGAGVVVIAKAAARSGAVLDQDDVAVPGQLSCPGRSQADPVFLDLDLPGDADDHLLPPVVFCR